MRSPEGDLQSKDAVGRVALRDDGLQGCGRWDLAPGPLPEHAVRLERPYAATSRESSHRRYLLNQRREDQPPCFPRNLSFGFTPRDCTQGCFDGHGAIRAGTGWANRVFYVDPGLEPFGDRKSGRQKSSPLGSSPLDLIRHRGRRGSRCFRPGASPARPPAATPRNQPSRGGPS